jgi:hypothetical protein
MAASALLPDRSRPISRIFSLAETQVALILVLAGIWAALTYWDLKAVEGRAKDAMSRTQVSEAVVQWQKQRDEAERVLAWLLTPIQRNFETSQHIHNYLFERLNSKGIAFSPSLLRTVIENDSSAHGMEHAPRYDIYEAREHRVVCAGARASHLEQSGPEREVR